MMKPQTFQIKKKVILQDSFAPDTRDRRAFIILCFQSATVIESAISIGSSTTEQKEMPNSPSIATPSLGRYLHSCQALRRVEI
jgi:hypothetical protein